MCKGCILIIDDSEKFLINTQKKLQKIGYTVYIATEYAEALPLLVKHNVNVVLQDLNFNDNDSSNQDGLECCKQIKEKFPTVSVIMISSLDKVSINSIIELFVPDNKGRRLAYSYVNKRSKDLYDHIKNAFENDVNISSNITIRFDNEDEVKSKSSKILINSKDKYDNSIEVRELLNKSFYEDSDRCLKIVSSVMGKGRSRSLVLLSRALVGKGNGSYHKIIKISSKDSINYETNNYQKNVTTHFPSYSFPHIYTISESKSLSSIAYSFVGGIDNSQTFNDLIDTTDRDTLKENTTEIFNNILPLIKTIEYYDPGIYTAYETRFEVLKAGTFSKRINDIYKHSKNSYINYIKGNNKKLKIDGLKGKYDTPINSINAHYSYNPTHQCITHGDLHGENILLDNNNIVLIDFARSEYQHCYLDFVIFENSLRLYCLRKYDDFETLLAHDISLLREYNMFKNKDYSGSLVVNSSMKKEFSLISHVRELAKNSLGELDTFNHYYVGLLYTSLAMSLLPSLKIKEQAYLLTLATILQQHLIPFDKECSRG